MRERSTSSGRRRAARMAGVLTGIVGLAGCASDDDRQTGQPDASDPSADGTGDGRTESRDGSTPVDCVGRERALMREIEELEHRITYADVERRRARERTAELEGQIAEFGGFPADVVSRAQSLGEQVRESVVFLSGDRGHGTGWFIEPGHVITNAHNVADGATGAVYSETVTGYAPDGTAFTMRVENHVESQRPDVAYLTTDYTAAPGLDLVPSETVDPGEPQVMVGHPGGVGEWVISMGLHVERFEDGEGVVRLRSTVPGRSGNSGSPVLTLDGDVVGIHYASQPRGRVVEGSTEPQEDWERPAPEPAEPFVYDWELAPRAWGRSYGSEDVQRLFDAWR